MGIDNAFSELMNDLASKYTEKRKVKPQPLNGGYRNRMWYRHVLKDKDIDTATDIITNNLKQKTFAFEADCAKDVFYEIFNTPYVPRAERAKLALEAENLELKKKLAELEAARVTNSEKKPIDFSEFPPNMNKDEFKEFFFTWYEQSQGTKPAPVIYGKAWKNYSKTDESETV